MHVCNYLSKHAYYIPPLSVIAVYTYYFAYIHNSISLSTKDVATAL